MSRKGTFSKAIHHLKSTEIDEKIQKLDEQPTNNTMGYMTATPNTPNPDFVHRNQGQFQAQLAKEPDFDVDDPDLNGKDTSGLFEEQADGTVIPRVAMPPITGASPDNSYILGPMAAMYYTWSYPWTMIGYIDEDRQMVNMARISGKLSDWDGVSNFNSGTWGGQLTLEQAVWFRDCKKKDDAGNDPANANYRAFYPGPPSNAPDAFGRYYCTVTGEPLLNYPPLPGIGEKENLPGTGGTGTPEDVLSAIMARQDRGVKLSKRERDYLNRNRNLLDTFGDPTNNNILQGIVNTTRAFLDNMQFGKSKYLFKGLPTGIDYLPSFTGGGVKIPLINPQGKKFADLNPFLKKLSGNLHDVQYFTPAANKSVQYSKGKLWDAIPKFWAKPGQVITMPNTQAVRSWKNALKLPLSRGFGFGDIEKIVKTSDAVANTNVTRIFDLINDTIQVNPKLDSAGKVIKGSGSVHQLSKGSAKKVLNNMAKKGIKTMGVAGRLGRIVPFLNVPLVAADVTSRLKSGDVFGAVLGAAQIIPGPIGWAALAGQVAYDVEGHFNKNGFKGTVTGRDLDTSHLDFGQSIKKEGYIMEEGEEQEQISTQGLGQALREMGLPKDKNEFIQDIGAYLLLQGVNPQFLGIYLRALAGEKLSAEQEQWVQENIPVMVNGMSDMYENGEGEGEEPLYTEDDPWGLGKEYTQEGVELSESRKTILKNLHEPVVLPETKQKSYKIRPRVRKSIKVGTNPNIAKPAKTPKEFRSNLGSPATWGQFEYNRNVRRSQSKKNRVLDLIGSGDVAFDYMLTDSKQLNAEQLEKFWGLHPELYSYFYNGKKYKAIRKEQVKGDYIVFLIDEDGRKSNILQSVLNEKLGEEQEMKDLAEYNRLHPKEPVSYEKDPLVTKSGPTVKDVAKRLKNLVDYEGRPATKGYPNEPPPKMVNGFHPKLGKNYKYDKLDPVSARAMPMQDNPEIDANIEKARQQPVIEPGKKPKRIPIKMKKEQFSNWRTEEKEKIQEASTTSNTFYNSLPSAGDEDLVVMQLGGTGDLTIDLGGPGGDDETMKHGGEFGLKWLDDIENVDDPHGTGAWVRGPEMGGSRGTGSYGHGYAGTIPGIHNGMMRNYMYTGDWDNTERDRRHAAGLPQLQGDHTQPGFWAKWGPTVHPDHELGTTGGTWDSQNGTAAIVNGKPDWGHGTVFYTNMSSWPRFLAMKAMDSTEFDTFKLHARVRANSIVEPGTQLRLFYWSGDKPGWQASRENVPFLGSGTSYDGWRPIYQKPSGEVDTDYTDVVIPTSRPAEYDDVVAPYSVKIPPWCKGKNSRFMLFQYHPDEHPPITGHYLVSLRFQRKASMTVGAPLDGPEGSSFMRVGQRGADKSTPQQRQKKIEDMLKASREYLMQNLGYTDFPGMGATLSKIAASPTSFGDVFQQHMDTLSPEDKKAFQKERKARREKTTKANTNPKKSKGKSRSSRSGNYDYYNVVR